MRSAVYSVLAIIGFTAVAAAQTPRPTPGFELRAFTGALVPVGPMRDQLKTGELVGAQVAREFNEHWHVVGSLGWAHSHNKFTGLAGVNDDRTFIWQYDAGVEWNAIQELSDGWFFRPLVGIGAGGRTYEYKATTLGTTSCAEGYGMLGTEFQKGIGAIRLEARDNVNCFESPITNVKQTRNDMGFTIGFVYHVR